MNPAGIQERRAIGFWRFSRGAQTAVIGDRGRFGQSIDSKAQLGKIVIDPMLPPDDRFPALLSRQRQALRRIR